jgi:hypothetical protein
MLNQSFRQVFVSNTPSILAQGSTVKSLGVGNLGILDAKNYLATTSPTYATNKALRFVWGTPDLSYLPLMAGVPNANIYSKLVKGKNITGWEGKAAQHAQNQIITVGWSGDAADTNTLFAKPGERRKLFLKLTGAPIDKLYSKQGVIREYKYDGGCFDPCGSGDCTNVDPVKIAQSLVDQITNDHYVNRFLNATVLQSVANSQPSQNGYVFQVTVPDAGDEVALGIVQAQYPTDVVTRVAVNGINSVYQITRTSNSTPSAVSNAGLIVIPNCSTCPNGYNLTSGLYIYTVTRADADSAAALTQVKSDYGITGSETASRIIYQYGTSTYVLGSTTALTTIAASGDILTSLGQTRNSCVLASPSTYAWSLTDTQIQYGRYYQVTLNDSVCGTNWLTQIQAAYPNNVVTIIDPSGTCVHTYQTLVYSQFVELTCSQAGLQYTAPVPFLGSEWVPIIPTGSNTTLAGIQISVAFVNRVTNECTYDYFPYEQDPIHLQASSFDPDYNDSPCETDWVTKQVQQFKYPVGYGAHIRDLERQSLSYELRERSFDPVVREVEGYQFKTNPYVYYDQYSLYFDFGYEVGGWSERYTDRYVLEFYFPEGTGAQFQNAINGYVSSVGILLDPVAIV